MCAVRNSLSVQGRLLNSSSQSAKEGTSLLSKEEPREQGNVSWANVGVDDLTAQAMLFFGAGFETTASLLSSTLYELSKPGNGKEIQGRVREEVDRVMKEDGGKITYEGLKRMHLLDRVLNETLRIHPPVGLLSRIADENYTIPGTDLKIEKNTMIFISTYSMQHDEKFFSEPLKFDPDRFLHRNEWNHFSFLPFGDGPRLCIGERFAMMQVRLGLAALLSKFDFDLCVEKTPSPLKYSKSAFILASETGIWVKVKCRFGFIIGFKRVLVHKRKQKKKMLWGNWGVEITLAIVTLVTLFIYLISDLDYWKKRGFPQIPGKPLPIFGHTFQVLAGRTSFSEMFEKLYKDAGDLPYAGMLHGTRPCLLVKDPELIRRILIKDFHAFIDRGFEMDEDLDPLNAKALSSLKGQRWKNMRARLSPTFTSGRMKAMLPMMQACSDELLKCLEEDIRKNSGEALVEMKDCLSCFSTDVIATCAFGIQCDALQNPETSEFRRMGKLAFQMTWKRRILFAVLLSFSDVSWANVDLDDLAAQAMLFFAAGLETTSSLSSFVLFELSKSEEGKEIQRNLQEEVDSVMQEDGGKITYAETLRIHPPAGVLSRIAVENYKIPETDLTLEKNTMVFIPTQAMQNDEKFFPEPKKFNPDRFLNKENYNHFAYLPFGDGPRLCIGERFALMQVRLGLAALLSKFEFDLCKEKTPLPMEYSRKTFILYAKSGIWLKGKLRASKK
ncbi:hypothetical protein J437_LFUL009390 [Ladona fulva]|uniref:Cytochrome P450 n=1 Tax=Ladona fulva TaxID=123851 RepID=A0A8K0P2I4_LADFU|nr:hypothetical protein J437_LFUL009390 [Ladona fulva]